MTQSCILLKRLLYTGFSRNSLFPLCNATSVRQQSFVLNASPQPLPLGYLRSGHRCRVLTPIVTPAILSLVEFSAIGPVTGEALPSSPYKPGIGNIVAGSLFATAQSVVVMGGAIFAVVTAIGAGVGGLGGAAIGAGLGDAGDAAASAMSVAANTISTGTSAASVGEDISTAVASVAGVNFIPLLLGATGATAGVVLAPIVASAALGVVGFSAAGPVAGSIAAGMQAGIGNVVAGSLFAAAQSAAATGTIPAAVTAVGAGMGAVGGAVAAKVAAVGVTAAL
ncbi:hypothetical protein EDB87DRAFT_1685406 [Lactarius vividus]|nr:hypothetical protein EDB87DRAFT_1685406 [Lactarius vividus]